MIGELRLVVFPFGQVRGKNSIQSIQGKNDPDVDGNGHQAFPARLRVKDTTGFRQGAHMGIVERVWIHLVPSLRVMIWMYITLKIERYNDESKGERQHPKCEQGRDTILETSLRRRVVRLKLPSNR